MGVAGASAAKARRRVHPMVCGSPLPSVVRPYLLFPSIPPRENRVEMALNYTDPIEFTTLPSGATCTNATTVFRWAQFVFFFSVLFPLTRPPNSDSFHPRIRKEKGDPNFGNGNRNFSWKIGDWKFFFDKTIFFFFFFFVILPSLMCYWKFL